MAYLLDTVALVLWWGRSPRLGTDPHRVIATGEQPVWLSAVNVWEIANKNRIGKLPEADGFADRFDALVQASVFALLDLTPAHAMKAGYLTGTHRDPFDRLLAGQALVEDMTVLTNDPQIAAFGCKVLW